MSRCFSLACVKKNFINEYLTIDFVVYRKSFGFFSTAPDQMCHKFLVVQRGVIKFPEPWTRRLLVVSVLDLRVNWTVIRIVIRLHICVTCARDQVLRNKPIIQSASYLSRAVLPGESLVEWVMKSPNVDKILIIVHFNYALNGIFPTIDVFSTFLSIFSRGQLKSPPSIRFEFNIGTWHTRQMSIKIDLKILVIGSIDIGETKLFFLYCEINNKNSFIFVTGYVRIFNFYSWSDESHHTSVLF